VRVVGIAPHEFEDLLRVLAGLQALAVRFQDGRLSAGAVAKLTECLDCCVTAVACDDVASYRVHDHRFHRELVVGSGSVWLTSLYDNLCAQAAILEIYFPHEPESISASLAEHWELLRQLAEGAPAVSEAAMEEHSKRSVERARRAYERVAAASIGVGETLDGAHRGMPGFAVRR
jgi:DNA-binding GntR family transcriptional regulator